MLVQPLQITLLLYVLSILAVLCVYIVGPLESLLLHGKSRSKDEASLIDPIYKLTVPKSYFTHFYIVLSLLSLLTEVIPCPFPTEEPTIIQFKNLEIIHFLLLMQGVRRTVESFILTKFSPQSKINLLHYFAGMSHYVLVSAIAWLSLGRSPKYSYADLLKNVSFIDVVLIVCFAACSMDQWSNHKHLANLRKYSLPNFKYVSSPHYLNEIQLYAILLIFSLKEAPWGLVQLNYLACWLFVSCNLSISSIQSYSFYTEKFKEDFQLKWAIIPWLV